MHQVLAEMPMSNRIIPLIHNLSHSQYPQELRFYYCIDLGRNPDWDLKDLVKNEKASMVLMIIGI
ncbi:hypothetical protein EYF80_014730 [Liparis tanakae]|uniref:Uncharacterized protein n=1 Tax=Liparis tanakae TaxID=230148 RepID=A0A4Z2IC05_9TELE|nr:hypothetical protein EYF80_014730 [Liparis tanakae]